MIEPFNTIITIILSCAAALVIDWGLFGTSSHLVEGWVDNVTYKDTLGGRLVVTFSGALLAGLGFAQDDAWFRGVGASLIIASTIYALYLVWKGKPE